MSSPSEEKKDRSGVVSIFDILFGGDAKNAERVREKTLNNKKREQRDGRD